MCSSKVRVLLFRRPLLLLLLVMAAAFQRKM
jgi:hypothetical protein